LFERLAVDVFKECDVTGAARILRLSWDEAWHLMERAVERGQQRKPARDIAYLGVDEKSAGRGHDYITLVSDLERSTVEYIADERKQASLDGYWDGLSDDQKAAVKAVAMDMWEPFAESVRTNLSDGDAKIVYDRFHIMGYAGKAVDTVRKTENRVLRGEQDATLVGSKYLWLYSEENLPERHRDRFAQLCAQNLKTGRAWAMKESLRELWGYQSKTWGTKFWKQWFFWVTHSRLQPMIDAARTLKRHLAGILNYFDHRITNAASEGINSRIQMIRYRARGYRNRRNFKTAIYFHCGGLDLYPATHSIPG
jgi:transposase